MHVLDGDAGHALGRIHRRADTVLGAVEMGDHAGFEAFSAGVVEAEHLELHRVALALEPGRHGRGLGDQAADFARANVERSNDALALAPDRGCVDHSPCPQISSSQVFPLGAVLVLAVGISAGAPPSSGAAEAVSRKRTVIRSSRRKSTAAISRSSTPRSCSSLASEMSASGTLSSGSMISTPEASFNVQRRSPTLSAPISFFLRSS